MSDFVVQGPKSDYRDSSGLKNRLYPMPGGSPVKWTGVRNNCCNSDWKIDRNVDAFD